MRKAFAETLTKIAIDNSRLAFVTGDLGFQVFDDFVKKCGPRYINAGVAEAQMIYTAAGMALEGWQTIAYSIASFATARPFEQIRFCVDYPKLPVVLVGAGRGYTYATSGVSHHAADDIALMSALPNMTVVIPGDPGEIEQLLPQLVALKAPGYFTVGRFGEPRFEAEEPATLGKARRIRSGSKIAVISTGEIINEVLAAADVLRKESITPHIYQMHTVKPLDTHALDNLSGEVRAFLIVDEHLPNGGLWSAIASWSVLSGQRARLIRLGPPDRYALGNMQRDDLREKLEYDRTAIINKCREIWKTL
jgi:transketolase